MTRSARLPAEFFLENRAQLSQTLGDQSFALVQSADVMWTSADGSRQFRQESSFFFLTGIDQEESSLLLCPGHPDPAMREVLFLRETSDFIAVWEGHKFTKNEATAISGIQTVLWNEHWGTILIEMTRRFSECYLYHNEHARSSAPPNFGQSERGRRWMQRQYPHLSYRRLAPMADRLRVAKREPEIKLCQQACDLTERGFRRALSMIKPGILEYEIEAEFLHEFVKGGSRGFAYEPIIAAGGNSNVLHYLANDQVCQKGDLILMDVGAEYGGYNADMTRTVPVSGHFSKRQRAVYEAVLRILKRCRNEWLTPGKKLREEYQIEVARGMEEELIDLGLLDRSTVNKERAEEIPEMNRSYRKYFMHGASHSLGLDVHDVTPVEAVIEEDMLLTIEPGIYLPDEGFGIRLENNVWVRSEENGGVIDLMADIPIEPDEIEALMAD